ncbi:MAG: hypothetical protein ACRDWY_13705 [Actinomycetes bacterium]
MSSTADSRLLVPARFNGPPGSANGGFVAGLLAARVPGDGPVQVTLREPPPLDVPLTVRTDQGQVVATFGGAVVVSAEPGVFDADPVLPVPFEQAAAAESDYAGFVAHPFPGCFVCGPDRPAGDGLGLRPGRLSADPADTVATTWVPDASVADDQGRIVVHLVWAALDCPSGWASDLVARPAVLGRITAAVPAVPQVGDRCVVVGRVLRVEGRKTFTASTAYDADGRVLGQAEATWIALRQDPAAPGAADGAAPRPG